MRNAIHECNDIHSRFTTEVPKIVEKSKSESRRVVSSAQEAQKKRKRLFRRLFGKKSEKTDSSKVTLRHSETARMLTTLHNDLLTRHQQQSRKVSGILDSLRIRNEVINKHLQNVITVVDAKVNNGIAKREQQIKAIENRNPYYYICMLSSLIPVFLIMFILVKKFAARMRKAKLTWSSLLRNFKKQTDRIRNC